MEGKDGQKFKDTVEQDETEIGKKRKGLHGHATLVLCDVVGAVSRSMGKILMETFQKLKDPEAEEGTRRFEPARTNEVEPFIKKHIATGRSP